MGVAVALWGQLNEDLHLEHFTHMVVAVGH